MKRRLLSMLMVVVLLVLTCVATFSMTSCGDDETTPTFEVPEGGYDGSEVTIKFYHTMGANLSEVLDRYIPEFNKLFPKIHVVWEQVGGYEDVRDQIKTEITVGNQPNIAYCYPDHVALYNIAGAVATLDNMIDSKIEITHADGTKEILGLTDEQKADFIKGYYDEGKSFGDGKMYSMPFSKSTEVLYYNADFFNEHKLKVPTTWDEMEAVCKQIKEEIDKNCIPLGYDSESNWFITMCEQYGYPYTSADEDSHFLFNNDSNKAFVKRFREWYQKGYVTTQALHGQYTSSLFVEPDSSKPRSYMSIGSSAGATHQRPDKIDGKYPFEVGITSIPQVNAQQGKVISQGPSVCIFNKDNPQEVLASWLFVKYLTTSVEFQAEFSTASGYVPVIKSVAENDAYASFLADADGYDNVAARSAKVCLEQEKYYFTSPAFNGSAVARDQVGFLITKIFTLPNDGLDAAVNKAFEDAVDECEYNS